VSKQAHKKGKRGAVFKIVPVFFRIELIEVFILYQVKIGVSEGVVIIVMGIFDTGTETLRPPQETLKRNKKGDRDENNQKIVFFYEKMDAFFQ
jgi:hypothetical protein